MSSVPDDEFHSRRAFEHRQMADAATTDRLRIIHLELAEWHTELVKAGSEARELNYAHRELTGAVVPIRRKMWN